MLLHKRAVEVLVRISQTLNDEQVVRRDPREDEPNTSSAAFAPITRQDYFFSALW